MHPRWAGTREVRGEPPCPPSRDAGVTMVSTPRPSSPEDCMQASNRLWYDPPPMELVSFNFCEPPAAPSSYNWATGEEVRVSPGYPSMGPRLHPIGGMVRTGPGICPWFMTSVDPGSGSAATAEPSASALTSTVSTLLGEPHGQARQQGYPFRFRLSDSSQVPASGIGPCQ